MKKVYTLLLFFHISIFAFSQTPCDLLVTTTIDDACFGGTGSGTVLVEGGNTAINYPLTATLYDYSGNIAYSSTILTGSGTGATGSGAVFSIFNLNPEDYTLVINDDTPCYDSSFVSVLEYDEIIITATIQDEIQGNDGSIFVSVSGGTAPYIYSWSTGETTSDIQSLTGGTYVLTVTDDNNCSGFISAAVQSYVGINEEENNYVNVYPNPANVKVTIEYQLINNSTGVEVFLYDIKGRKVFDHNISQEHNNGRFVIDVTKFLPGTYNYVLLFNNKGKQEKETGRIVITR